MFTSKRQPKRFMTKAMSNLLNYDRRRHPFNVKRAGNVPWNKSVLLRKSDLKSFVDRYGEESLLQEDRNVVHNLGKKMHKKAKRCIHEEPSENGTET